MARSMHCPRLGGWEGFAPTPDAGSQRCDRHARRLHSGIIRFIGDPCGIRSRAEPRKGSSSSSLASLATSAAAGHRRRPPLQARHAPPGRAAGSGNAPPAEAAKPRRCGSARGRATGACVPRLPHRQTRFSRLPLTAGSDRSPGTASARSMSRVLALGTATARSPAPPAARSPGDLRTIPARSPVGRPHDPPRDRLPDGSPEPQAPVSTPDRSRIGLIGARTVGIACIALAAISPGGHRRRPLRFRTCRARLVTYGAPFAVLGVVLPAGAGCR